MKKSGYKSVFHIYIIFVLLFIGTITTGFGMILYNITIKKPNGQPVLSKWPIDFTDAFSESIKFIDNEPHIKSSGLKQLQENNLWIQLLDSKGDEIFHFNKPKEIPEHYSPSEFLKTDRNGVGGYSVFSGSVRSAGKEWTYRIGFPVRIAQVSVYVNKDRFTTGKPVLLVMMGVMLVLLALSGFVYGYAVTRQMARMRRAIREIASRTYLPVTDNGAFGEVYDELSALNTEIRLSDAARAEDEKLREEWIANITHDLKTPLSPIRGYAELIAETDTVTEPAKLRRYGGIILKNTAYAEELINDLKLTYQLENGMVPLNLSRQDIVRFIKELVIDLLNNPEFEARNLSFCSAGEQAELSFDATLLKRAFNNLLTNALVHNGSETGINVSVGTQGSLRIVIRDDGRGMTKEELDSLFTRYYRGKDTQTGPEGSGLGMAIAKQIIELHGGRILAESKPGSGTCITVEFLDMEGRK